MKEEIIKNIRDYLYLRDDVVSGYIFGSYSAGRFRSKSDVDIAVLLSRNVDIGDYGNIKLGIIKDLMKLLSFDRIDVVILNIASPLLAHEVIKKGLHLFSKDDATRINYIATTTKRYLDTIYLRKVQDRILHEKIRTGKFGYFKGSHKYSIEKIRKSTPDTSTIK
ncbi:MAG: type VII toxin-antitoxin system MntA family adenylyltransferase antitoxin [Thermodesulfovibrionales bacterium]